jgi:hypothetical protein|nr:MAG TPA: hypothetical protein [Caudoviricetes sp.]
MAYVILVNEDNTLTASKKERIMQRSKLFNNLWFLAEPTYNGYDMSACTVVMEYILPISKKYHSDILELSEDGYQEYLKYVVPIDSKLTAETGEVELQLTFIYSDLDENGESVQRVRKTSTAKLNIIPISAWSDIIPDSALGALDQRIIKMDAQIKELLDLGDAYDAAKADNIAYDADKQTLQLLSGENKIGDEVSLNVDGSADGTTAVDFSDLGVGTGVAKLLADSRKVVSF